MWHRHFCHLAEYNRWANLRLLDAVEELSDVDYRADLKVFFRSIHGTLNHVLAMDLMWFGRIDPPGYTPPAHDVILADTLADLRIRRDHMDERIIQIVSGRREDDFEDVLHWISMDGNERAVPLHFVLTHAFNHQTHHRGQIHAMLSQLGVEPPAIDFYWVMFDDLNQTA